MDETQNEVTTRVLIDFSRHLSSVEDGYSIYYKNGGSLVEILTIIPRDSEETEKKIYSSEAKILNKYSDKIDVRFRLMPKYKESLKSFVPAGFERYAPAN